MSTTIMMVHGPFNEFLSLPLVSNQVADGYPSFPAVGNFGIAECPLKKPQFATKISSIWTG